MQLCILTVCIIYCIQFTNNAHRYRISFSSYSCFNLSTIICVAVHVIRMLHTCYNLPYHRYNHQFVRKLFGVQIRCLFTSLTAFQLVPLLPSRFFVSTPHIWPKMDMPIQYRFGRWIYNAISIKDASTYLGILIQALVPYCPGSVKVSSHSDTIWPRNNL